MSALRFFLFFCGFLLTGYAWCFTARAHNQAVFVNESQVVSLRTTLSGQSPQVRAKRIAENLNQSPKEDVLKIKKTAAGQGIYWGRRLVVQVNAKEAAAHQKSVSELAQQWALALKRALALPPLQLSQAQLRLPEGGSGAVRLEGTHARKATLSIVGSESIRLDRRPGELIIRSLSLGKGEVLITSGVHRQKLSVLVLPYAAKFPQTVNGWVAGQSARAESVASAIRSAVSHRLKILPGGNVRASFAKVGPLSIGQSAGFRLIVKADSAGSFPASGEVVVRVRNLGKLYLPEKELWYCNDPENIRAFGALFHAELNSESPVRLLYHHLNAMPFPIGVQVRIWNPGEKPAKLFLIPGDSKPTSNPVLAGIIAADQFMQNWLVGSGEVIELPPKSSLPIALRRLAPRQTMSGLCYLRLLEGGPEVLQVTTQAIPTELLGANLLEATKESAPWCLLPPQRLVASGNAQAAVSEHIYPHPFRDEEVTYQVGGRYGFVRIGQKPIAREDAQGVLDGNFGVIYRIQALIENPLSEPSEVEVVFEPSAGYSGALFVLNGRYIRTPLLQAKEEFRLTKLKIMPGEKRKLSIQTVPLSGSSYPATLTLRLIETKSVSLRSGTRN